jgi:hypothetical protein
MIENAIRAARLDLDFYNAVETDESFTAQAALLVLVVSVLSGVGVGLTPGTGSSARSSGPWWAASSPGWRGRR